MLHLLRTLVDSREDRHARALVIRSGAPQLMHVSRLNRVYDAWPCILSLASLANSAFSPLKGTTSLMSSDR